MQNTELPIDLENQVQQMKRYVNFRQRKRMREFLEYAGYFRASRYGKFLLTQVNKFGTKANIKMFFALYDFDMKFRQLFNNRDNRNLLPDDTNLFSRLYALKKVLPEKEATCLGKELETLISKTKLDIYRMNILPRDWKDLYQQTSPL